MCFLSILGWKGSVKFKIDYRINGRTTNNLTEIKNCFLARSKNNYSVFDEYGNIICSWRWIGVMLVL